LPLEREGERDLELEKDVGYWMLRVRLLVEESRGIA